MNQQSKNRILEILSRVEGNGHFCTSGEVDTPIFGLRVKDVGNIGFPIHPLLIDELLKKAHRASYGKGSKTLLDENVRSTWEIDAKDISFINETSWLETVNKILVKVKQGLGLKERTIEAQLYKLLIYEEGDFFLPHQDTEKAKGMFGTLTIGLPVQHSGGALSIRFNGAEEKIDFSLACNNYNLAFAAFYADCEHEVHPVNSGYRFILTYNLLQVDTENGNQIKSPIYGTQINALSKILLEIEDEINKPVPILLDHQYTPDNFNIDTLKNHDRPKVEIILQASRDAGYFAFPALLTYYQSGSPDWDYDDSFGLDMVEIYDETLSIEHWMTNEIPDLGEYFLEKEDVISAYKLTEADPIEREEEGYMGNYGPTLNYWYHYGAVLIWPQKLHKLILSDRSVAVKLDWLDYYHNHWADQNDHSESIARSLVTGLRGIKMDAWNVKDLDFSIVIKVLLKLNDPHLTEQVASDLLYNIFERVNENEWVALLTQNNENQFKGLFNRILISNSITTISHFLRILALLLQQSRSRYLDFIKAQLRQLAQGISKIKTNNGYELRELVRWLITIDKDLEIEESIINDITQGLLKDRSRKFVNAIINELIATESKDSKGLRRSLVELSYKDLKQRVDDEPKPPVDWKREIPNSRTFQDVWKMLTPFLQSPDQTVFEYSQRKELRDVVEAAISNVTIDLKYETIKRGSPHTLKITKTQSAYLLKQKEWKEDLGLLKRLEDCFGEMIGGK